MLLNLISFVVSAVVLARASIFLVETLTKIALKLRISEFLVGFMLMAVATSLPEFLVGVVSAIEREPLLSLGNVIGSNIANLTLVLGLAALTAKGIRIQSHVRNREIIYMNLCAISPFILLLDGSLSRVEGAILLVIFAFYFSNLIFRSKEYPKVIQDHRKAISLPFQLLLLGAGLAVLLLSAEILIHSGIALANFFGIPPLLIGLFALAIGTSLPELSFEISAASKRRGAMLMGDIMGSVVANSTLVLGTTAIIHPIVPERLDILTTSVGVLISTLLVFTFFIRSEYRISIKEGLTLVLGYLVFVIVELLFGTLR